jgi:hypothetical protein
VDPGQLEHRAHAAAGDDAGTGRAGLSRTWPEPKMPVVWWVIVEPCCGTRKRFFFARSTPFWMASGTSLALP